MRHSKIAAVSGSGAIYAAAIVVLLLGEVVLAREMDPDAFGAYQLVRQAAPLVVMVALLGFDQALTREIGAGVVRPVKLDHRQLWLILQMLVAGVAFAGFSWKVLGVPVMVAVTLIFITGGLGITTLVSANMRASGNYSMAAMTQQGNRLFLGAALIIGGSVMSAFAAAASFALAAIAFAILAVVWLAKQPNRPGLSADEYRTVRILGVGFSLSMVSFAATDWLDQAIIASQSDNLADVGEYAASKLLALYPLLSLGSILGFIALPELARRRQRLTPNLVSVLLAAAAVLCGISMLVWMVFLGQFFGLVYDRKAPETLLIILAAVGGLRLFYVLPSSIVGALGTNRDLLRFGFVCILAVVVQAATTFALLPYDLVLAAAIGLLAGMIIRLGYSVILAIRLSRRSSRAPQTMDRSHP